MITAVAYGGRGIVGNVRPYLHSCIRGPRRMERESNAVPMLDAVASVAAECWHAGPGGGLQEADARTERRAREWFGARPAEDTEKREREWTPEAGSRQATNQVRQLGRKGRKGLGEEGAPGCDTALRTSRPAPRGSGAPWLPGEESSVEQEWPSPRAPAWPLPGTSPQPEHPALRRCGCRPGPPFRLRGWGEGRACMLLRAVIHIFLNKKFNGI